MEFEAIEPKMKVLAKGEPGIVVRTGKYEFFEMLPQIEYVDVEVDGVIRRYDIDEVQPYVERGSESGTVDRFKQACWLSLRFVISRYLMSNADGRWNGAEKAQRHIELCSFYVAAVRGLDNVDDVDITGDDFIAVHDATRALTDYMDEAIGFPLKGMPDYDSLEPLFFEKWHELAMSALDASYLEEKTCQE